MSNNPSSSSSSSHHNQTSHIGGAPLGRLSSSHRPPSADAPPSPPTSTTRRTSATVRLPPFRLFNSYAHQLQLDFMPPPSSLYQASASNQPAAGPSSASTLQRLPRVVRRPRPSQPSAGTERVDFGSLGSGSGSLGYELAGEGEDWDWEIGEFEGPGGGAGQPSTSAYHLTSSDDGDEQESAFEEIPSSSRNTWTSLLGAGQATTGRVGQRIPSSVRQREQDRTNRLAALREGAGPGQDDGTGYVLGQQKRGKHLFETAPYLSLRPANLPKPNLPTHFSPTDRSSLLSVSPSGFTVSFIPRTSRDGEQDAAAVRANAPVDPACGLYYFEVEIVSAGERGYIGIGFSAKTVHLNRLPGWEKDSYGYHGDDGLSFASQGEGKPYSAPFTTGDVIGCGIDFSKQSAFYTKNGVPAGELFAGMRTHEMYPTVGLRTPREVIRANFGQFPFKYDIANYFASRQQSYLHSFTPSFPRSTTTPASSSSKDKSRAVEPAEDVVDLRQVAHLHSYLREARLESRIKSRMPLQPGESLSVVRQMEMSGSQTWESGRSGSIEELVKDYLLHQGFASTFDKLERDRRAFQDPDPDEDPRPAETSEDDKQLDGPMDAVRALPPPPTVTQSSIDRKQIRHLVSAGDLNSALDLLNGYPTLKAGELAFELQCCHLVSMILASAAQRRAPSDVVAETPASDTPVATPSLKRKGQEAAEPSSSFKAPRLGGSNDGSSSPGRRISSPAALIPSESASDIDRSSLAFTLPSAELDLDDEIFAYGRQLRHTLEQLPGPHDRLDRLFSHVMGLLAFNDPLLDGVELGEGGRAAVAIWTGRARLAAELVEAMLQARGELKESDLETFVRHTIATHTEMGRRGKGTAAFVDVRARCLA